MTENIYEMTVKNFIRNPLSTAFTPFPFGIYFCSFAKPCMQNIPSKNT